MSRFALVALVVLVGCSSQSSSGVPGTATSAISARVSASPTPTPGVPLPAEVENWSIYESSEYGFALRYPPTWFSLGHLGAPPTEAYFSNQKDAGSPMNLGADSVFIGLSADCQAGPAHNVTVVSQDQIAVGSVLVVRYVLSDTEPDGAFYAADATVIAKGSCYRLFMVGRSLSVVQANLRDYDLMLSSLRFSHRTAPIATPNSTVQST